MTSMALVPIASFTDVCASSHASLVRANAAVTTLVEGIRPRREAMTSLV